MDVLVFSTMQLLSWENTKHDEIIIHYWDCLIQAFMIIFEKNLLTPDSFACKDLRIITDFCPTSSLVIFLFNVSSPSPFSPLSPPPLQLICVTSWSPLFFSSLLLLSTSRFHSPFCCPFLHSFLSSTFPASHPPFTPHRLSPWSVSN